MERMKAGFFSVTNPYNRKTHIIPVPPGQVAGIVFWSKNYRPFLDGGYGPRLLDMGLGLYFHFTVNSFDPLFEPNLPPFESRLEQFGELAALAGKGAVNWRFDPICHYTTNGGPVLDNLGDFDAIAEAASEAGVGRCTTSFLDHYPKVMKRVSGVPGLGLVSPGGAEKALLLKDLQERSKNRGIELFCCCETETAALAGVPSGACIDHGLLERLWKVKLSGRADTGQRRQAGCGCHESRDVGDYGLQPCPHGCLYCYANPVRGKSI